MINNLSQGGEQDPLPGSLQQRVENAQSQLEVMEAEYRRLVKFVGVEKGKIDAIHAEKVALETKIKDLNETLVDTNAEVTKREDYLGIINGKIDVGNKTLLDLNKEAELVAKESQTKKTLLDIREGELANGEKDLATRVDVLTGKEVEHRRKVERLQEALK